MLSQFADELRCLYCRKPNPATEWRAAGDFVPFYFQREPGKYNLTMTCPHCDRAWYVVWDDNPGELVRLAFPDTLGPAADGSPTDPNREGFIRELLSDKAEVRNQAIERARKLARRGDSTGLQALAEAIRRRSGKPHCQFHTPGVRVSNLAKLSAAQDELRALASKRQLLNDPKHTQSLLAQIPSADFHELWAEVGRLGGEQEWLAFQLLGTHLIVRAELLKRQRERGDRMSQPSSVDVKPVADPRQVSPGSGQANSQTDLGRQVETTELRLACPHCAKRVKAPKAMAGKTAQCPSCGRQVVVPQPRRIDEAEILAILEEPDAPAIAGSPPVRATGSPGPAKERGPVEVGSGLPAGAIVPKAGKYRCEFCGRGGMADLVNQSIAELLGMTGDSLSTGLSEHARKQTIKFFQEGARFTKCPNCGPATGWILEDDVR